MIDMLRAVPKEIAVYLIESAVYLKRQRSAESHLYKCIAIVMVCGLKQICRDVGKQSMETQTVQRKPVKN